MKHFGLLKTAVVTVMMLFVLAPFAKAQTIEDGTEEHPFLIESEQEFWAFHDCMIPGSNFYHDGETYKISCTGPNCKLIPTGGSGKYFKLMTDIVVNEGNVSGCDGMPEDGWIEWVPIGSFNGVFDGNYHTVSGLYCNTSSTSVGFFAGVSGEHAVVKNLGVVNSYIKGNGNVGGIAGVVIDGGTITHSFFEGTVESSDVFTGGIASICSNGSSITDCYTVGNIFANDMNCGGIVGYNYSPSIVANCYTLMVVRNTSRGTTGSIYGYNTGTVSNCYYDKQLSRLGNTEAMGKLTVEMTTTAWTAMGSAFQAQDGLYPFLTGFDVFNNPEVRLSVLPLFLYSPSSTQYETLDEVEHDIELRNTNVSIGGDLYSTTWSVVSWNECVEIEGNTAKMKKQGFADLIVTLHGRSHTYIIYSINGPSLGTDDNPLTIDNKEDLKSFRDGINLKSNFTYKRISVDYRSLPNMHWVLTDTIDAASLGNWTPIGNSECPFTGYFDGGKNEIKNLQLSGVNSGFFGYVRNADIRRLGFRNPSCTSTPSTTGHVGALAADVESAVIDSCYATGGSLIASSTSMGGLIGCVPSKSNQATGNVYVTHCFNDCGVKNTGTGHTAGLIGSAAASEVELNISNCHNTGAVQQTAGGNRVGVGGILGGAGEQSGSVINISFCYNTGNITAKQGLAGGVLGDSRTTGTQVSYCFNTGDVYVGGANSDYNSAGGVAGLCAISNNSNSPIIQYCFNTGKVTLESAGSYERNLSGVARVCSNSANYGDVYTSKTWGNVGGCAAINATKSYNVGRVTSVIRNGIATGTVTDSYYDSDMSVSSVGSNAKTTTQLVSLDMGDGWLNEAGMYPRMAWTDSLAWARDIAIAAATPVRFATEPEDADHVKPGVQLFGHNNNIVWKVEESGANGGCLFTGKSVGDTITGTVSGNAIVPTVADVCMGSTVIGAYVNGQRVKRVTLYRNIEVSVSDTLTIDSLANLITLRDGVNSGIAFMYKETIVPAKAENVHFLLRVNLNMKDKNITNWEPIGSGDNVFDGIFLGNNHTISNLQVSGKDRQGLFGNVSGIIRDLNLDTVNITTSSGRYTGAICAFMTNAKISNCTVKGTIATSYAAYSSYYAHTGGLVGYSSGTDTIENCKNYASVRQTGNASSNFYHYGGGVLGGGNNKTRVIRCENYGPVCFNNKTGGIIGTGGNAYYCANMGEVTGNVKNSRTGGIVGETGQQIHYCYNVGTVTAIAGSTSDGSTVGGICGTGNPQYSYNAGEVMGSNRQYVGGICGSGAPKYCYNSNTVRGTGSIVRSITAYGTPTKCYYDKQLSPALGRNGADAANVAEGLLTKQMLGDSLKGANATTKLGDATIWNFSNPTLYPQLRAMASTAPSVSSVMPVRLADAEVWNTVSTSFLMHGCNVGDWVILQGSCVTLNTEGTNCGINVIDGMSGLVQLGAEVNDVVYRKVRLKVGVSATSPVQIVNQTQLKNFRDVINAGSGYYDQGNFRFLTTFDTARANYMMEISDGGADMYFKLTAPNDSLFMTGGTWEAIGTSSYPFKGVFLGNNRTIRNLEIGNGNNNGLFGYLGNGSEVRDLNISRSSMTDGGQKKGLLCGYSNGGVIYNCSVDDSKVGGSGKFVGAICGYAENSIIRRCTCTRDTVNTSADNAATVCGYGTYVSVDSCAVDELYMTASGSGKGGVVGGGTYGLYVAYDTIRNSVFYITTGGETGGIVGGHVMYAGSLTRCVNINCTMYAETNYLGGITGFRGDHGGDAITYCKTIGGSITSTADYVGGICGDFWQPYGGGSYMSYCYNETPVKGKNYVGGINGRSVQTYLTKCYNYGSVTGTGKYVGGITGELSWRKYLTECFNAGDVTGAGDCVGGIVGNTRLWTSSSAESTTDYDNSGRNYIINSFNVGQVTGKNMVGGIAGNLYANSYVRNCYNAGIVKGVSQVGGIAGLQNPDIYAGQESRNNYSVGWVEGTSMLGAICGYTSNPDQWANNYYDKQMCRYAGISNEDVAGTTGKMTSEMLGSGLSALGEDTRWNYTEGMYPRLKSENATFVKLDTTRAAVASATPVLLEETTSHEIVYAKDVPTGTFTLGNTGSMTWARVDGFGVIVNNGDHTFAVNGRNRVKLANIINGDTLKVVQLVLGVSEEHPLEIVSEEQLKRFRDLINANTDHPFYYNPSSKVFVPDDSAGMYIEILPGGEGMFFQLTCDVNLALDENDWTPIGNYNNNSALKFKGHFDGDGHTISGLHITEGNKNYQGFFGYLQGTVENLVIESPEVTCNGNYHGALAGYNYGTIRHCYSYKGEVRGTSYVGGLAGENSYDQMSDCYNGNDVSGASYVGGIAGNCVNAGIITRSFNYGIITATADESRVGGIAGASAAEVSHCYNTGTVNGQQYTAGIVGESLTPYVQYCYNAGYVSSASTTYVGAIVACNSTANYPAYSYYDHQLCPFDGGVGYRDEKRNSVDICTELYTEDMLGNGTDMFAVLNTSGFWTCTAGEYPRLASTQDEVGAKVSTKPVLMQEYMPVNKIGLPLTVQLGDGVAWSRYGTGSSLDLSDIGSGNVGLLICGPDSLVVALNGTRRMVPMNVFELTAELYKDTICGGVYIWEATGRMYTRDVEESVYIPVGDNGCNKVMRLSLTIPPALELNVESANRRCYGTHDAYAKVTITGGFEQGYTYKWTKEDVTIQEGETDAVTRLDDLAPGTYHLVVNDKVHSECIAETDVVITEPTPLVGKVLASDSRCWNTDDGYFDVQYSGGTVPYKVRWESGAVKDSVDGVLLAGTHTFNSLADGTYNVRVIDNNSCYKDTVITIADVDLEYNVKAVGVNKMYDGQEVDLARYILKIGDGAPETIASGGFKVLSTGDTLRATVTNPATVKNVISTTNGIASITITYNGEDKACRYNLTGYESDVDVIITKRNVTLTSADSTVECEGAACDAISLTNHRVTVGGAGFVAGEDTLSTTVTRRLESDQIAGRSVFRILLIHIQNRCIVLPGQIAFYCC